MEIETMSRIEKQQELGAKWTNEKRESETAKSQRNSARRDRANRALIAY